MNFCPECGTKVNGMKFCPECGRNLQVDDNPSFEFDFDFDILDEDEQPSTPQKWEAPKQYYISRRKSYELKESQRTIINELNLVDDIDDVVIACGTYKPNKTCFLAVVTVEDVYFIKTEKEHYQIFSYQNGDFTSEIFDPNKLKFNTKDYLGFKFSAINNGLSIDTYKIHSVAFEILQVIASEYAEAYFKRNLTSSFISQEKINAALKSADEKISVQKRIESAKQNSIACCPKCGSTSLSANKKGFGIGKAVVGASVAGPIGLVAGNAKAKKIRVTCLNCGHQWWAGKK